MKKILSVSLILTLLLGAVCIFPATPVCDLNPPCVLIKVSKEVVKDVFDVNVYNYNPVFIC